MNLSQEDIDQIVQGATAELKLRLQSEIADQLQYQVTETAQATVRTYVEKWISDNVIPEVATILQDGKHSLVAAASQAATGIAEELSKQMVEEVSNNLKTSYKRKKIFQALFVDI